MVLMKYNNGILTCRAWNVARNGGIAYACKYPAKMLRSQCREDVELSKSGAE